MPLTWPAWRSWLHSDEVAPAHPAPPAVPPVTLDQYMMGRQNDQRYVAEWTFEVRDNALELLRRVNQVLPVFGQSRKVRSGWRPRAVNASLIPPGAKNSLHIVGLAIDLDDSDGALHRWLDVGPDLLIRNPAALRALEDVGLWMESPHVTTSWIHWQSRSPTSGRRTFNP
jgi:hypothetical protein